MTATTKALTMISCDAQLRFGGEGGMPAQFVRRYEETALRGTAARSATTGNIEVILCNKADSAY